MNNSAPPISRSIARWGAAVPRFSENPARVHESQFADDVVLYTTSRDTLEQTAVKFVREADEWGLTVSTEKTKGMAVGNSLTEEYVAPVKVKGGEIEMVEQFTYFGSVISKDGGREV